MKKFEVGNKIMCLLINTLENKLIYGEIIEIIPELKSNMLVIKEYDGKK